MVSPVYDIEVAITFLPTESGGRRSPIFQGYRPQFYCAGHDWDGMYHYLISQAISSGQSVSAYITFLSPEYHVGVLHNGTVFQLREGSRIVGHGQITCIQELVASAKQSAREHAKRYFKRYWPEHRGDIYSTWGGATYYFVCTRDGYPDRQVEVYDNGIVLLYDDVYVEDGYGMLANTPLDLTEFAPFEITEDIFWNTISTLKIYNRPEIAH